MEHNENKTVNITQPDMSDVAGGQCNIIYNFKNRKKKKAKILILCLCIVLIIASVVCLVSHSIKVKNHDEFVTQIQSIGYLTQLINNEVTLEEYTYLTDFEDWSWHESDNKTIVYTLRKLEGDETKSIHFTFDGKRNTLSRIWCNDMQLFVNFFLPDYKGQNISDDELSRIIRKNIGLGFSINGNDTFQPHNQIIFNNCVIEVNTYKVEFGEWFFGREFTIKSDR